MEAVVSVLDNGVVSVDIPWLVFSILIVAASVVNVLVPALVADVSKDKGTVFPYVR